VPGPVTRPPQSLRDAQLATDRDQNTRATSQTPAYRGMWLMIDLGSEMEISRIVQMHGAWPDDYANEYKVEVSRVQDETRFREVWRGRGEQGRSLARFNPVFARFIRITALSERDGTHWWSIAELRSGSDSNAAEEDEKRVDRPIVKVSGRGISDVDAVRDTDPDTSATTRRSDYAGSSITLDMGASYLISRVVQVHNPDDMDYPGRYSVDVSDDGNRWQIVWQGNGEQGRSRARFNQVRARFVRITATANLGQNQWWSMSRVRINE